MADVFTPGDALRVLRGKSLLFMGDSIMRNIYKDLVFLVAEEGGHGQLIPRAHMCRKGESSFMGDRLVAKSQMNASREYREERDWYDRRNDLQLTFKFITRCYGGGLCRDLERYPEHYGSYPDFIIINSALWDINRWGPMGIDQFKQNIQKLMALFRRICQKNAHTQVVWMTTPPISADIRAGIMIQQLEFQAKSMRFNIMEGNQYAATVTAAYGFDVLDMHYHFTNQIHRRSDDGVHWNSDAVRMQVNIILTHFCLSREIPLPGNWPLPQWMDIGSNNLPLQKAKALALVAKKDVEKKPQTAEATAVQSDRSDRRVIKAKRRVVAYGDLM